MKNTTVAAREFSIDGFRFLPGDEVDIIALGKDNVTFRTLVHSRHVAFGPSGRTFSEVAEDNGYDYDEETGKATKRVVEEKEEAVETAPVEDEVVSENVEEAEVRSRTRRRN